MYKVKFYFYNAGLEHYWIKRLFCTSEKEIYNYLESKCLPFELKVEDIKFKVIG